VWWWGRGDEVPKLGGREEVWRARERESDDGDDGCVGLREKLVDTAVGVGGGTITMEGL